MHGSRNVFSGAEGGRSDFYGWRRKLCTVTLVAGAIEWNNLPSSVAFDESIRNLSQLTFRLPAKIYHHGYRGCFLRFVGIRAPVPAIWRAANPFKRTSCARVRGEYESNPRRTGRGYHPQFRVYYRSGVYSFRGKPGETYFTIVHQFLRLYQHRCGKNIQNKLL